MRRPKKRSALVLAGDVGGTKTTVALFARAGGKLRLLREQNHPSSSSPSLEEVLRRFFGGSPPAGLASACFAVAGPVQGGRVRTTNLPWRIEEGRLARLLGTRRVKLLNDLEGTALGLLALPARSFRVLQRGVPPGRRGNVAVVAPGTGCGEGILLWDGRGYRAVASEGGHTDFGPRSDVEIDLLRFLRARTGGHVSYERILSGEGMSSLYDFVRDTSRIAEPGWLQERLGEGDRNAVIAEIGLAGGHPLCVRALDLFCSILGAEAANLALKVLALGGVVLAGGIPPKILGALDRGPFLRAFTDKGRYSDLMGSLSVRVSLEPRAALLGAARYFPPDP